MDEFRLLLEKLRRLLRSRGRSIDDTDDLIQEAFLRLQRYCREHAVDQQEAFLVRTTLNLSVDQSRQERREPFRSRVGPTVASVATSSRSRFRSGA